MLALVYGSTTDTERGVEGQLVGIDGDDGIIKLPDGDYKIMDMSNSSKLWTRAASAAKRGRAVVNERAALEHSARSLGSGRIQ